MWSRHASGMRALCVRPAPQKLVRRLVDSSELSSGFRLWFTQSERLARSCSDHYWCASGVESSLRREPDNPPAGKRMGLEQVFSDLVPKAPEGSLANRILRAERCASSEKRSLCCDPKVYFSHGHSPLSADTCLRAEPMLGHVVIDLPQDKFSSTGLTHGFRH